MAKKNSKNAVILSLFALLLVVGIAIMLFPGSLPGPQETDTQVSAQVQEETLQETDAAEEVTEAPKPEEAPKQAVLKLGAWYDTLGPKAYGRNQIASITFTDSLAEAGEDAWDVSEQGDGAILAWTAPSAYAEGLRDLFIGSTARFIAGDSLSFRGFTRLQKLTLNGMLDTSERTQFDGMFQNVGILSGTALELDLSTLDVSAAKGMQRMFCGCSTLASVNLEGWNVSSAADCTDMFYGCRNLQQLDIAGWKLAPECITTRMIHDCKALTNRQELVDALGLTPELTQADFTDPLTELTGTQLVWAAQNAADALPNPGGWVPVFEGDIGESAPAYANMDLDGDGNQDSIIRVKGQAEGEYTFELHMGNGQVVPMEITESGYGCCHCDFYLTDINSSGQPDILAVNVHTAQGAGGQEVSYALYADTLGKYYRVPMEEVRFTMEDLQNGYVCLACLTVGYREVIPFDYPTNLETESPFAYYFGSYSAEGLTDHYQVQGVKVDGSKLVVMYNFHSSLHATSTDNPFAVVWNLMPGGYFSIERIGTDVIRDYWLSE